VDIQPTLFMPFPAPSSPLKETTQIPSFVRSLQQTTISLVSKRVGVCRTFGMGPKTGGSEKYPLQTCFLFWIAATIAGVAKTGSLSQARLRLGSGFAHLQLRLKQQLLRSKDRNGNCSCRDSDVEYPVTERGVDLYMILGHGEAPGMDQGSDFEGEFRARRIRLRGNFAHKSFYNHEIIDNCGPYVPRPINPTHLTSN
jgi:hypothetical protein